MENSTDRVGNITNLELFAEEQVDKYLIELVRVVLNNLRIELEDIEK